MISFPLLDVSAARFFGLLLADVALFSSVRRLLLVGPSALHGHKFSSAVLTPAEECVMIGLLASNAPAVRHPTVLARVPLFDIQLLLPAAETPLLAS